MKVKRLVNNITNNKRVIALILLFILGISLLIFSFNKSTDNVTLDDVKLNAFNNKSFAILVTEDGNDYHECDNEICNNSSFPGVAYIYEKSVCLDDKGETVDNALTFDSNTRKATVKSSKTLYCTLYFNKDTKIPVLNTFYINDQTQNKYTNNNQVTIHMAWSDSDVKEYCVTNENSINNCIWNPTGGELQKDDIIYTLTQSGLNTLYGFIRDNANNVSAEKYDSITYDTGAPIITSFYIKGNTGQSKYTNSGTRQETATVTWNDNDIAYYCIIPTNNVANCDNSNNWKTASSTSGTLQLTLTEGSNTYYAFLKDKAGNKSTIDTSSSFDTIVLDTIAPTANYDIQSGEFDTPQTITITPYDSGSGVGVWSVHVYRSGVVEKDATKSVDNLAGSLNYQVTLEEGTWTVYTSVSDKAGNRLTQTPNNGDGWYYQIYTIKSKPAGSYVDEQITSNGVGDGGYASTGVRSDPLVKRFYGTNPNNYICFGANLCQDRDNYMYRIIGATSDGKLKIVKQTKIGYSEWANQSDDTWETSKIRNTVNGNLFYTNESLVPNDWKQYIDQNPTWCIGDVMHSTQTNASEVLALEITKCGVIDPIGLVTVSDYFYARDIGGDLSCWDDADCYLNWINYSTGWTMNRASTLSAWYYNMGRLEAYEHYKFHSAAAYPVFYLVSTVKLSGTGKTTDPFIITGLAS